jgi:hypothetical protein
MRLSLLIEVIDGVPDGAFESVGIGQGAVGELMLLEVAPASFDVVQLGRVFRQPLEGKPSALMACFFAWPGALIRGSNPRRAQPRAG